MRIILALLLVLLPSLALAQALPSPRFRTPPVNDNSEGAATTSHVGRAHGVASVGVFGAIADGTSHPISERFATLSAAQAKFCPKATSLSDEIDWCAIQTAADHAMRDGLDLYLPYRAGASDAGNGQYVVNRTITVQPQEVAGIGSSLEYGEQIYAPRKLQSVRIYSASHVNIRASAAMTNLFLLKFDENLGSIGPFWLELNNLSIDCNHLADTGIYSDYVMHLTMHRNTVMRCNRGLGKDGYGAWHIQNNQFSMCVSCIEFDGGGDMAVLNNHFDPGNDLSPTTTSFGITLRRNGGNTFIAFNTFNRNDAGNITGFLFGVHIKSPDWTKGNRDTVIQSNEFCGYNTAVYVEAADTDPAHITTYNFSILHNHTRSCTAAGVTYNTGTLAELRYVQMARIAGNYLNAVLAGVATDYGIKVYNSRGVQVTNNIIWNYINTPFYFQGSSLLRVTGNDFYNVGQGSPGNGAVDVKDTIRSRFSNNTLAQDSSSYGQSFIRELAGTSDYNNCRDNYMYGAATKYIVVGANTVCN